MAMKIQLISQLEIIIQKFIGKMWEKQVHNDCSKMPLQYT